MKTSGAIRELGGGAVVQERPFALREYLSVVRYRKWTILVVTAFTVAVALTLSIRQTPIYASTAQDLVKPVTANSQIQANVPTSTLINMDTENQIAQSSAVR